MLPENLNSSNNSYFVPPESNTWLARDLGYFLSFEQRATSNEFQFTIHSIGVVSGMRYLKNFDSRGTTMSVFWVRVSR